MARLYLTLLTFWPLLYIGVQSQSKSRDTCIYQGDEDTYSFYEGGDMVLGGIFPLHSSTIPLVSTFTTKPKLIKYKLWMQTMIFAVREINQRQDLLPNLYLGYHIRDSGDDIPVSVKRSLLLVNGQPEKGSGRSCEDIQKLPSPVIVGEASSGVSMAVLRTLGSFKIPLVSYFASCSCLSNKREFPTFMRTMPSDLFQIKALVKLVHYFQWTWVGVIGVESDYARFAIQLFLKESERFHICPAYVHIYPVALTQNAVEELVNILKSSSATVIINFSVDSYLHGVLKECRRQNVTHLQWIASEAWATSKVLWDDFGDLLKGTLGFAENWPPCNGSESLDNVYTLYSDVSQLRVSYNVYKAVYLIAHALHDMTTCEPGKGPFQNGTCGSLYPVLPWQLLYYLKQTHFTTLGEEVRFDDNGDPIASYDLMNWQRGSNGSLQLVRVGFYDASLEDDNDLVIDEPVIMWHRREKVPESLCSQSCLPGSRKARQKGKPVCCFDCIPCAEGEISNQTDSIDCLTCSKETWPNQAQNQCIPKTLEFLSFQEPLGIILWAVSAFGACAALAVLVVFILYRNTPVVRGNNIELSFLLLLFLCACFLIGLTFIGKPTNWLCQIRYSAFAISFTLCISCILSKTVVVLMAFKATLPGSNVMKWFGPAKQRSSVILCTFVQALICIVWLTTNPPVASYNNKFMSATMIVECTVGSEIGYWCVLGYIGFLSSLCFLLAFLARKLPDNFNEAKFITFSMLIFFAVWITFIPVYVSSRGKYMVAVHVFAILASAFGLLLCIFAPKCYIVLLKPERNDKKLYLIHHILMIIKVI
uniref:G-protein coupled receptors family 3 profile domain-containing protein n=1 Tax=Cyprinus carpio TaxID=7962 RepID=A0A8C2PY91_CYPCA